MAGQYQSQPEDMAAIVAMIRKLEARLDSQNAALAGIGLHIDGATGNLIIDANAAMSSNFDGVLSPPAAGTMGWAGTGAAFIVNTLVAKNAIIDDNTLTNPVRFNAGHDDNASFALSTTMTSRASITFAVPAGFSTALVSGVANVTGRNSRAVLDFVACSVFVNGSGSGGTAALMDVAPGATGGASRGGAKVLTGLSGGSITVASYCQSGGAAWAADAFNTANIDASVVWLR